MREICMSSFLSYLDADTDDDESNSDIEILSESSCEHDAPCEA